MNSSVFLRFIKKYSLHLNNTGVRNATLCAMETLCSWLCIYTSPVYLFLHKRGSTRMDSTKPGLHSTVVYTTEKILVWMNPCSSNPCYSRVSCILALLGSINQRSLLIIAHLWRWALFYIGFPSSSNDKQSACNVGWTHYSQDNKYLRQNLNLVQWDSLVAHTVKNLPVMQEIWVQTLCWEATLEKGMATHFSILAWKIPWT